MSRIDLDALMAFVESENGAFYWIKDKYTGLGASNSEIAAHPWVFADGYRPNGQGALPVAMPRSTSPPRDEAQTKRSIVHSPHGAHDGQKCALDKQAHIYGDWRRPIKRSWIEKRSYICAETDLNVLGQIQALAIECS